MSQDGCVTTWHTDFSATSVVYVLLKGVKEFFLIRPSENNMRLFNSYLAQPDKSVFFGDHPELDDGGCQKVTLVAGSAVVMPAGMIHMVATHGLSVALGMNFIHIDQLALAANAFAKERMEKEELDRCYPDVPVLILTLMAQLQ